MASTSMSLIAQARQGDKSAAEAQESIAPSGLERYQGFHLAASIQALLGGSGDYHFGGMEFVYGSILILPRSLCADQGEDAVLALGRSILGHMIDKLFRRAWQRRDRDGRSSSRGIGVASATTAFASGSTALVTLPPTPTSMSRPFSRVLETAPSPRCWALGRPDTNVCAVSIIVGKALRGSLARSQDH